MKKGETETRVLRSTMDVAQVMTWMSSLHPTADAPITMTIAEHDEDRSLKQNRLSFMWYMIRGGATGHGKEYERSLCKLLYGVPILRRDDADFNSFWMRMVGTLPYETQLDAMEYIPVTSLMKVKQFAEYLTTIDNESAAIGIVLPRPEDLYWDALMQEADSERD